MLHALYHALAWNWGGDGQGGSNSLGYLLQSGIVANLGLLAAAVIYLRRHNCHARWCPFVGRHAVEGTPYVVCRTHHPTIKRKAPTVEFIHHLHAKHVLDKLR